LEGCIIALDQGTTSSRAVIYDRNGKKLSSAQHQLKQYYPQPGWVEHDPMDILETQLRSLAEAFEKSGLKPSDIAGIGVTNQRETAVIWEKDGGRPIYNAIVWQCRRTAPECEKMKADGLEGLIKQKTGLVIDAYFSGTKYQWLLDNLPGARARAERGELLCGTVESWLIWNLTGGVHISDYSNASRTMLMDIKNLCWDEDLCRLLNIPQSCLPRLVPNSAEYGVLASGLKNLEALAGIPICGAAGDQQAALFGQGCYEFGQIKNTYGTGCFTLMNAGRRPVFPKSGLLGTVAWDIGQGPVYAVEGSVFNAGSSIQWLRDELGLIKSAPEVDRLAESVDSNGGVYVVSAFTGLGAPHWDMYARGAIFGLTRGSTKAHIARAVLEGIAFQTADLVRAMETETGKRMTGLRVDGGASVSDFMLQFQSDLLQAEIDRPTDVETTALGAAYFAGLAAGVWRDTAELAEIRSTQRLFKPAISPEEARRLGQGWEKAVARCKNWAEA